METQTSPMVVLLEEVVVALQKSSPLDFISSNWENSEDALRSVRALITNFKAGKMTTLKEIEALFSPTGSLQEVSLSGGWGEKFIAMADRADQMLASTRGTPDEEEAEDLLLEDEEA